MELILHSDFPTVLLRFFLFHKNSTENANIFLLCSFISSLNRSNDFISLSLISSHVSLSLSLTLTHWYQNVVWLLAVVPQSYSVNVMDEHVLRGNAAIVKCHIPSFVIDFVYISAWILDDNGEITEIFADENGIDINSIGISFSIIIVFVHFRI